VNEGCNHSKIGSIASIEEGRHCAFMTCPNYREKCPLHAIAKTGEECNLTMRTDVTLADPPVPPVP
jgi:hypothetical protein